jgi:hypothetical protein
VHFVASGPWGEGGAWGGTKIYKISNVILEYKIRPFRKGEVLKNKGKNIYP